MRIALISDIHGNLIALDAVLNDLEPLHPDQIVCLGDVALLGPQPLEVTQRLQMLGCPVVMGNTDEWLLNPGEPEHPEEEEARRHEDLGFWCLDQLSQTALDYLKTFQPTLEFPLDKGGALLCFHGSPKNNREVILATTPDDELTQMLSGVEATILAGGHTHAQMLRRYRGQIIVNPGSVGLPIEQAAGAIRNPPWAEYALITIQDGALGIELRRVPFDLSKLVDAAQGSGMPHVDWWTGDWG
jgi:predicted phosphodiesterase